MLSEKWIVEAAPTKRTRRLPVYWNGPALLAAGRVTEARAQARRILKANRSHLGALEVMCQVHIRLNEPEAALRVLRQIVRLNPTEVGYELVRACALEQLGRWKEALEVLTYAHARAKQPALQAQIEREIDGLMQAVDLDPREGTPVEVFARPTRRALQSPVIN